MERIKFATLWSQRRGLGPYVEFVRSEESLDPEVHPEMMEVLEWKTNYKVGTPPPSNLPARVGAKCGSSVLCEMPVCCASLAIAAPHEGPHLHWEATGVLPCVGV